MSITILNISDFLFVHFVVVAKSKLLQFIAEECFCSEIVHHCHVRAWVKNCLPHKCVQFDEQMNLTFRLWEDWNAVENRSCRNMENQIGNSRRNRDISKCTMLNCQFQCTRDVLHLWRGNRPENGTSVLCVCARFRAKAESRPAKITTSYFRFRPIQSSHFDVAHCSSCSLSFHLFSFFVVMIMQSVIPNHSIVFPHPGNLLIEKE